MNSSEAVLQLIIDLRIVIADNENEISKLRSMLNEQNNSMTMLKTALDNALEERDNLKTELNKMMELNPHPLVSTGKKVSRIK